MSSTESHNRANVRKNELLGMSHGTAANRLRKMVLFSLVCELNKNFCFQCGQKIISVKDLSIEHKKPWQNADDPVESFFDLSNIAFSHLSCNVSASAATRRKYTTKQEEYDTWRRIRSDKRAALPVEKRQAERRRRYKKFGC